MICCWTNKLHVVHVVFFFSHSCGIRRLGPEKKEKKEHDILFLLGKNQCNVIYLNTFNAFTNRIHKVADRRRLVHYCAHIRIHGWRVVHCYLSPVASISWPLNEPFVLNSFRWNMSLGKWSVIIFSYLSFKAMFTFSLCLENSF